MIRYCARIQRIAPRMVLSAVMLLTAGEVYGQSQASLPAGPARVAQVPYLADHPTRDDSLGVHWMPFESVLLNASLAPLDGGSLRHLSGTWLGTDSLSMHAYADSARRLPGPWNLTGYCSPLAALTPGCASAWGPARLDTTSALDYGLRTQWRPLQGLSLGLGYHRKSASGPAAGLLLPGVLDFLAPGWNAGLSVPGTRSAEGVDLNMAYGFDAGFIGEVEFQLRLSHELNRGLRLDGQGLLEARDWPEGPLSHASFGFNWNRGDFSGSLSSRYVDSIFLNGQPQPASWTSLDINFAWRTPWDANLSVGAKNLLGNEPPMAELGPDSPLPVGLDEAFSSIPYVRYEQDL